MKTVEPLVEICEPVPCLARVESDEDLVALPVVADVGAVRDRACLLCDSLAVEPRSGLCAERFEDLGHLAGLGVAEDADVRLGELVAEVGREVSMAQRSPGAGGMSAGTTP